MEPVPPFWFKQRQCKVEPVGTGDLIKVTGPNLGEAFLSIQQESGAETEGKPSADAVRWKAAIRLTADGAEVQSTGAEFTNPSRAWDAAFELYRNQCII